MQWDESHNKGKTLHKSKPKWGDLFFTSSTYSVFEVLKKVFIVNLQRLRYEEWSLKVASKITSHRTDSQGKKPRRRDLISSFKAANYKRCKNTFSRKVWTIALSQSAWQKEVKSRCTKKKHHSNLSHMELNHKEFVHHLVNLLSLRDVKTLLIVKCER